MKKRFTTLMTTLILSVFFTISASAYDVEVDGIYYNFIEENKAEVTFGDNKYVGDIIIPEKILSSGVEYEVIKIGDSAFLECKDLLSIKIANTITSIGLRSFFECNGLKSIYIPNSVKDIGAVSFAYCHNIDTLYISNTVEKIGGSAFERCTNIRNVRIPNSTVEIGDAAFQYCENLENISIPNSVTRIGAAAMVGCRKLKSIKIPNRITTIEEQTFFRCPSIEYLYIPNSVKTIKQGAFWGCFLLKELVIPASVERIEWRAFNECGNMKNVYFLLNSATVISIYPFESQCYLEYDTLHVPKTLLADYKSSDIGKKFANIVGFEDSPSQIMTFANAGSQIRYATYSNNLFDTELYVDAGKYLKVYDVIIEKGELILKERLDNKVACGEGVLIRTNSELVNVAKLSGYDLYENFCEETMLKATFVEDRTFVAPQEHKLFRLTYNDSASKSGLGFYYGVVKDENGIVTSADGSHIFTKPYKAYLEVPVSELGSDVVPSKAFVFDDNGLSDIEIIKNINVDNLQPQYDLNGQRANESAKGLKVIKNRKYIK